MSIMIPSVCLDFDPRSRENQMFQALKKLPDGYYVLYSVHLYDTVHAYYDEYGRKTRFPAGFEHEVDFLIFVPGKKAIVIEAKAPRFVGDSEHGIKYDQAQQRWFLNGKPMAHNGPFEQASQNRHWIVEAIRNRFGDDDKRLLAKRFNAYSFSTVWFPCISQGMLNNMPLPANVGDKSCILTMEALNNPQPFLDRIHQPEFSHSSLEPLGKEDIEYLLNNLFAPSLNFLPSDNYLRDSREGALKSFTKAQSDVLYFLEDQHFAAIAGKAGTGKTFIACEKARIEAEKDETVLFLCYNALLAKYLKRLFDDESKTNSKMKKIQVDTIDGFTCRWFRTATPCYNKLYDDLDRHPEKFIYQNVIVDEAQDFGKDGINDCGNASKNSSGILSILKVLMSIKEGDYYVFYDKDQLVNNERTPEVLIDPDCKITLYKNCRNTKAIASTSLSSINPELKENTVKSALPGNPPTFIFTTRNNEQDALDKLLATLPLSKESITILTPYIESTPLNCQNDFYSFQGKKIPFYTCRRFKGMESDTIILVDIDKSEFASYDRNFYVGSSRAKFNLFVITTMSKEDCAEILTRRGKPFPPNSNTQLLLAKSLYANYKIG
ncbi:MAG TPA: hypothetical protein DCZ41_03980 [Firmicutes bacterium]|mgnify:CR=1 FL=1|nr:hypothetical protein [Bacillota bacterium]